MATRGQPVFVEASTLKREMLFICSRRPVIECNIYPGIGDSSTTNSPGLYNVRSAISDAIVFVLFFNRRFSYSFSAPKPSTLPSILEAVGGTPLVKLNKIPQSMGLKCNVCKH